MTESAPSTPDNGVNAELRALSEEATPGPWEAIYERADLTGDGDEEKYVPTGEFQTVDEDRGWTVNLRAPTNAELIVAAVNRLRDQARRDEPLDPTTQPVLRTRV